MKAWQIFLVGIVGAVALFSFHAYESALAGVAALAIITAVVLGFCLHPRKEVFYLRTTIHATDPDYALAIEHDRLAVRVELARLWLLFIATFASVAFLVVTFVNGTTWRVSLLDSNVVNLRDPGPYPLLLLFRSLTIGVFVLLTAWVSERWILRDASACSAAYVRQYKHRIIYSFLDPRGEYYGGEGLQFGSTGSPQLRTIVLYRTAKPHLNKIAMCCLFHRLVIVGRGLTDLDEATVAAHSMAVQPVRTP